MAPAGTLALLGGALVWALVVLATYFAGAGLFLVGTGALVGVFALAIPVVWLALAGFWTIARIGRADRLRIAALVATPGLLINAMLFLARDVALPGFTPGAADRFAAFVMWTVAVILAVGLRAGRAR